MEFGDGLIAEYDSQGNEIRTYGYEPGSLFGTNPLFQKVGTEHYWYLNDHLGTPQKIVDGTGNVVWAANYEAFGKATVTTGTITNNMRFPGQYYDQETGLHYNWYRYYDPSLGRYLSSDPIWIRGGLNLYVYVSNMPIDRTDQFGLEERGVTGSDYAVDWYLDEWNITGNPMYWLLGFTANLLSPDMSENTLKGLVGICAVSGGVGLRIKPVEGAGPHTVYEVNPQTGKITRYETFQPQTNPRDPNPYESVFRYDASGKPHFNKATQQDVPTPHVHDPATPGGVRPPSTNEIP